MPRRCWGIHKQGNPPLTLLVAVWLPDAGEIVEKLSNDQITIAARYEYLLMTKEKLSMQMPPRTMPISTPPLPDVFHGHVLKELMTQGRIEERKRRLGRQPPFSTQCST